MVDCGDLAEPKAGTGKARWTSLVQMLCRVSPERPKQPYSYSDVFLIYHFSSNVRHDADNYAGKFLLDGLTKAGVIVDDDMNHIRLHISQGRINRKNPWTEIIVNEVKHE